MEWFTRRGGRSGDKLWLGQWDHGVGIAPNRRGLQWTYALQAWFDKQLAQRDVQTGPPVELFMSDGTFAGAASGDRTEVLTAQKWTANDTRAVFKPAGDGTLASRVEGDAGAGRRLGRRHRQ